MAMVPRIGVLTLVLVAMSFTPQAAASGCIDVELRNFGSGLHVIADTGREIAFGFVTGYPGEGVGAVLIITPTLCGALDIGAIHASAPTLEPASTSADPMLLLPLP